jgi:hypothetical protein
MIASSCGGTWGSNDWVIPHLREGWPQGSRPWFPFQRAGSRWPFRKASRRRKTGRCGRPKACLRPVRATSKVAHGAESTASAGEGLIRCLARMGRIEKVYAKCKPKSQPTWTDVKAKLEGLDREGADADATFPYVMPLVPLPARYSTRSRESHPTGRYRP